VLRVSMSVILILASTVLAAESTTTCRLEPSSSAANVAEGFGGAVLTVEHSLPVPVVAVALRAADGGPWLVTRLAAPPGHATRQPVLLPATSADQTYTVRLYTRDPVAGAELLPPAADTRCSIQWPLDRVGASHWIDPTAHEVFGSAAEAWPTQLRQQILIALAAMSVLGGFALLARGRRLRGALVLAVAGGGAAAMVWMIAAVAPHPVSIRSFHLLQRDGAGRTRLETLTVLAARRTGAYTGPMPVPSRCLYADRGHMAADAAVAARPDQSPTAGAVLAAAMRAGDVRMVARRRLAPQDIPLPGIIGFAVDLGADRWEIEPSRATPPALLVVGSRVARVGATARRTPRQIDRSTSESIHTLYSRPERFGFDADTLDLFRWWNQSRRDVDRVYLVWPSRLPDGPALYAVGVGDAAP